MVSEYQDESGREIAMAKLRKAAACLEIASHCLKNANTDDIAKTRMNEALDDIADVYVYLEPPTV